jgi:hypothetical protein
MAMIVHISRVSVVDQQRKDKEKMFKKMAVAAICILGFATSASAQTVTGSGTTNTVPVFTGTSAVGNSPITVSGSNVGIGTTAPDATLHITNAVDGARLLKLKSTSGVSFNYRINAYANDALTVSRQYYDETPFDIMSWTYNGNVGIGTTAPGYKLDVAGVVNAQSGVRFPDGNTQMYAFNPANCGADYAESVDVSGDRTKYEAGDVLVIDPDAPGKFLKSNQAYSTLVAGIYSTKPGFVGRLEPATAETKATEVPMAMVGRVPTKVTAENGPIKVGDLLVASSTMGYAMKGTDRGQMLGAVIGKALGPLDSGTGVVMALVTLQ